MALDHELPVWGVRPNWAQPIIETLEWKTDVLASGTGAEQRIAYRLTPRRLVEARYNPHENERTFTDLALHRLGSSEWMAPLWFDASRLTSNSSAGSSRLNFPTAYHEFSAGGMAYLVGPDCFTGEAVRIQSLDANGINLVNPLGFAWPVDSIIHPLRRARFESPSSGLLTSRLSELTLRFEIIEGNDLSSEGAWATSHSGIPVLTSKPNWSDRLDLEFSWLAEEYDSETGRKYVSDEANRVFRTQRHAFMLVGAQEQFEFRQMLYRLRGRQKPVWVSSQADDLKVAVAAALGVTQIDIEQVGMAYVGGPVDGRDRVYFPNGQILQFNAAAVIPNARERLTFTAPTSGALNPDDRLSFIETCRLAADSVEIEHLGDTYGVATSTLAFAAFADRRTATTATSGIPAASKVAGICGSNFILANPDFEEGTTGWSGTLAIRTFTANGDPAYQGINLAFAGANSFSSFYQNLNVPESWIDEIDSGTAAIVDFAAYHQTFAPSQTDRGRLFVEFRTAANVLISRVNTAYATHPDWTLVTLPQSTLPAGTRIIRFGAENDRLEGSNNDNYWDAFMPGILINI